MPDEAEARLEAMRAARAWRARTKSSLHKSEPFIAGMELQAEQDAAEIARLKAEITLLEDIARLYEELRSVTDGGSESMTHEEAVQNTREMLDREDNRKDGE